MTPEFEAAFRWMYHLQALALVLVAGLYGYAIYGTIVITRILHEIQRNTRRPEQD